MLGEGQLQLIGNRFVISDEGKNLTEKAQTRAFENLGRGRLAIRRQIEEEIGTTLTEEQFASMWRVLQDNLVLLFYTRGREMVNCISSLVSIKPDPKQELVVDWQPFFVADLAKSVAATCSSPEQAQDVQRAIEDIFSEGIGPAFDWLVDVCSAFLALCSLGLEATSGEQIRQAIASISLVLDTDVVLSLLCEGEPDHISVNELVKHWRDQGGKILVADPVLRETSHHAWIAQQDFDQVSGWLPGSDEERARYIRNAYVRGFAVLMAKNMAHLGHWKKYIEQFRGKSEDDPARVAAYLRDEARTLSLPRVSRPDTPEEVALYRYCEEQGQIRGKNARELKISEDKARRDAELYVSLNRYLANIELSESGASAFLVSSSRRLVRLEEKFGPKDGEEGSRILSIATAVALLAIIPGVSIGITAMRAFLFDGSIPRGMSDLEMALRRVLRESTTVTLPFARRRALKREVRTRIVRFARDATSNKVEQDKLVKEIEDDFKFGTHSERAAVILSGALDSVSADRKIERDLADAQKRIAELELRLKRRQP